MIKYIFYILFTTYLTTFAFSEYTLNKCDDFNYKYLKKQDATQQLKIKTMDLMDESTEGGTVQYFFEDKKLKIIKVKIYGEMGKIYINYYIVSHKKQVYFVSFEEFLYNSPIYEKNTKINKKQKLELVICDEQHIKNMSKQKYKKSDLEYIIRIYNKVNRMLLEK